MGHGAFVVSRRVACWDLWYPTHFTKDVQWMGHGAFVVRAEGGKLRARIRGDAGSLLVRLLVFG